MALRIVAVALGVALGLLLPGDARAENRQRRGVLLGLGLETGTLLGGSFGDDNNDGERISALHALAGYRIGWGWSAMVWGTSNILIYNAFGANVEYSPIPRLWTRIGGGVARYCTAIDSEGAGCSGTRYKGLIVREVVGVALVHGKHGNVSATLAASYLHLPPDYGPRNPTREADPIDGWLVSLGLEAVLLLGR